MNGALTLDEMDRRKAAQEQASRLAAAITKRCQHCGFTRKDHDRRAPYHCPTRLTETSWTPWTVAAFEQAETEGANPLCLTPKS